MAKGFCSFTVSVGVPPKPEEVICKEVASIDILVAKVDIYETLGTLYSKYKDRIFINRVSIFCA